MTEHNYSIGDILYSSWGYDQTNIDFYEVVGITAKSVKIRRLHTMNPPLRTSVEVNSFTERVEPVPGDFASEPMTKRVRPGNDGRGSVKISSYAYAYYWDGSPKYQTAWGYGH